MCVCLRLCKQACTHTLHIRRASDRRPLKCLTLYLRPDVCRQRSKVVKEVMCLPRASSVTLSSSEQSPKSLEGLSLTRRGSADPFIRKPLRELAARRAHTYPVITTTWLLTTESPRRTALCGSRQTQRRTVNSLRQRQPERSPKLSDGR